MEYRIDLAIIIQVSHSEANCLRFGDALLVDCPFIELRDHRENSMAVRVPITNLTPAQVAQVVAFSFERGCVHRVGVDLGNCHGHNIILTKDDVRLLHNGKSQDTLIDMWDFSDHYDAAEALAETCYQGRPVENDWVTKPFRWLEFFAALAFTKSFFFSEKVRQLRARVEDAETRAKDMANQRNRYLRILRRVNKELEKVPAEPLEGEVVTS